MEANQRYGIIEAVIHLVNRDFVALADLYKRLGFIPRDQVQQLHLFVLFLILSRSVGLCCVSRLAWLFTGEGLPTPLSKLYNVW